MDLIKKETPVPTADQVLIKETGGEPGTGNLEHPEQMRTEIGNSTGSNVTPESELADKSLEETEKADFLEAVAGVKPEEALLGDNASDLPSAMENFGQSINSILPEIRGDGEDNVRTASSKEFGKLVEGRKAA